MQNLAGDTQRAQSFYDSFHSYMIAKEIDCSITKTSLKKLRLHRREY